MAKYRGKNQHRTAHPKIFVWSHTEKAEIEYFQGFKNHLESHRLMPKREIFWKPQELIKFVINWKNSDSKFSEKDKDQVWCIFDVDDFYKENPENFLEHIKLAEEDGVKIAFVNECFELWILLHFEKVGTQIRRGKEIEKRIQKLFEKNNLGNFQKNQDIFKALLPFQKQAIDNAHKLLKVDYKNINWRSVLSDDGNPSTTIHLLIEEINKLHLK